MWEHYYDDLISRFDQLPVSARMISYLVDSCRAFGFDDTNMFDFVVHLVNKSLIPTGTLMASTIYLNRLAKSKNSLPLELRSARSLLLGSIIVTAKFTTDSSPLNKYWASYTQGSMDLESVNAAERNVLAALQWNLDFSSWELYMNLKSLINAELQHHQQSVGGTNIPIYTKEHARSSYSMGSPSTSPSLFSMSDQMRGHSDRDSIISDVFSDYDYSHQINHDLIDLEVGTTEPMQKKNRFSRLWQDFTNLSLPDLF